MATLYVRNFSDELYQWLKDIASEEHRSMGAEITVLVEKAKAEQNMASRHAEALARIAERRERNPQPPGAEDTLTILRRDRSR